VGRDASLLGVALFHQEQSEVTDDKGVHSSAQQQQMMEFLMHDADEAAMGPQLLQKEACVPGNNVLQQLVVTFLPLISPSATSSYSQPRPPTPMHRREAMVHRCGMSRGSCCMSACSCCMPLACHTPCCEPNCAWCCGGQVVDARIVAYFPLHHPAKRKWLKTYWVDSYLTRQV
jgi:hypothetical protein